MTGWLSVVAVFVAFVAGCAVATSAGLWLAKRAGIDERPAWIRERLAAGKCAANQRAPGGITCFDLCDLPLGHDGLHETHYDERTVTFSDQIAATSWRLSAHEWGAVNGLWSSRKGVQG